MPNPSPTPEDQLGVLSASHPTGEGGAEDGLTSEQITQSLTAMADEAYDRQDYDLSKTLLRARDAVKNIAETILVSLPQARGVGDEVQCERCAGNGEIVTDWARYRQPRDGDRGDEAVAECPDCCGRGTLANPQPALTKAVGDEEVERALEAYQRIMFAHALNVTVTGEAVTRKEAKFAEAVFKARQKAAMRAALATLPPAPGWRGMDSVPVE